MSLLDHCLALPSPATPLLIAVSGGADSMALLALLQQSQQWPLHVFHLDHQLRDDSHRDSEVVAAFCQTHAIPVTIERADIAALAEEHGQGIEEAARNERYRRLAQCAQQQQIDYVVTAHHRDDQIETILLNLLRGAATSGLSGMRPSSQRKAFTLLRPCLDISRQALRAYARSHEIPWREDSSNIDQQYRRNYIRHTVIPEFETACPGFGELLLERAADYRQQRAEWESAIDLVWDTIIAEQSISLQQLQEWPRAQRQHFWRNLIMALSLPLSRLHIHRLEQLFHGQVSKQFTLGTQRFIKNPGQIAWVQAVEPSIAAQQFRDATVIADYVYEHQNVSHCNPKALGPNEACVNTQAIQGDLYLRPIKEGERWQALGAPGTKSVMSFLADKKHPLQQRQRLIVCADEAGIIWVPGYTIAERMRLTAGDEPLLLRRVSIET